MFRDGFLDGVLEEIKQNSKVKFKESDLFRVYQSIDLANLKEGSLAAMPSLGKLRETLYSQEYRSFVEGITNLPQGTLTEQIDSAANCHAPGCHLLCHDDVIGTRKISYIIYLTEKEWTREEGGCLELYESEIDRENRKVPKPIPSKRILPTFNTMAYFVVDPGNSFHSVQEVFGDRPRLSIQGMLVRWSNRTFIPVDTQ
jgi:Rps23 Pro-64 3,4-dihydroxylase Tpa1-like proline 4-hydroxylase